MMQPRIDVFQPAINRRYWIVRYWWNHTVVRTKGLSKQSALERLAIEVAYRKLPLGRKLETVLLDA